MTRDEFKSLIEKIAPPECSFDWDNSGFNIIQHDNINKIYVCLDATPEAVLEAAEKGCDTILSHHPILFRAIKIIDISTNVGKVVSSVIKNNMNLLSSSASSLSLFSTALTVPSELKFIYISS